jgi:hypothetical protein
MEHCIAAVRVDRFEGPSAIELRFVFRRHSYIDRIKVYRVFYNNLRDSRRKGWQPDVPPPLGK